MSRESALVKNTIVLGIGTFLPKLASLVILPILTGYLTTEEYGTYDLITVLVSLLLPAVTLQIQTAAFRFLIDERDDEEGKTCVISSIFAFIVPASLVALIVAFPLLGNLTWSLRLAICAYFFVDIVETAAMQCIRGLGRSTEYTVAAIIGSFGQLLGVVILVLVAGFALDGAVWALFIANFIALAYLTLGSKLYKYIRLNAVSREELKHLLAYSWPMVPNSMSMWVMRASNRLVISIMMGIEANAVFAVAYKIPQMLSLAHGAFTMAWQENASIAIGDSDADAYYTKMLGFVFRFLAGAMALILGACPLLFALLVRGDYDDAYAQIPILLMGMLFYGLSAYLGGIYVAQKRTASVGVTTVISACINLLLDFTLIPTFGLYAASLALLVSYVFLYWYRLYELNKGMGLHLDGKLFWPVIIFLVAQCAIGSIQSTLEEVISAVMGVAAFLILNQEFLQRARAGIVRKLMGSRVDSGE